MEVIPIVLSLKNSALRSMSEGKDPIIREGATKYGSSLGSAAGGVTTTIPATYDNGKYGQIVLDGGAGCGGGGDNNQTTTPLLSYHQGGSGAMLRGSGQAVYAEAYLSQQDEYQRLFRDTTSSSGDYSYKSALGQGRDSGAEKGEEGAASDLGSPTSPHTDILDGETEKAKEKDNEGGDNSSKWGWFGY